MNNKIQRPERNNDVTYEWIVSLIKFILLAVILLVVFILGCKITLDSFEKNYGDMFIPRKNVEVTIDDIKYAVDANDMTDAERIEYIRSSIDTLEAEIKVEED